MTLTRYFASRWDAFPHIAFDMPLGNAGYWRHSWQWSILDFGTNDIGQERIRIIYPTGAFGNFAKDSTNALHMTFLACTHERVLAEGTNYYLMFLDGTKHHFTKWTNGATKLFRMEATFDPYSNRYDYAYTDGRLSQVTGPNTNQWLRFSYELATNAITAGDVEFTHTDTNASEVLLAGSFNDWQGQSMSLVSGVWTRTETLDEGLQFYKFVVRYAGDTNDYWRVDPDNSIWAYTGSSTSLDTNSAVIVDQYFLTEVAASDGRTCTYSYGEAWMPSIDNLELPLVGVDYGDGTSAEYSYYPASNDLYRKTLMATADDPHYEGPARAVRYSYQTNLAYSGQVHEERNLVNSQLLARLVLDNDLPERRIVESGTGDQTIHDFGENSSITNAAGYTLRAVHFGGDGMLWKWIDEMDRTNVYERTLHFGRATSVWNSVRGTRTYTYTSSDYPFYVKKVVDEAGRTNLYTRDGLNRVTRRDYPGGTYETFSYNTAGQVVTNRQRDGTVWTYRYDAKGRRTSDVDPLGHATHYTYDDKDRLATISNALGHVTRHFYNWRGDVTNTVYADGTEEVLQYDTYGQTTQRVDRAGGITSTTYDDWGYQSAVRDPLGHDTLYSYDVEGNLVSMSTPLGFTITNAYDGLGRKVSETYSSDTTTRFWHYSPDGVTTQVDRLGQSTTFSYTPEGWLQKQIDPLGRETSYGYDQAGNRTHVTNALGDVTTMLYDLADRIVSIQSCSGEITSNVYDGVGRVIRSVDANGIVTSNTFDSAGRLITVHRGGLLVSSNGYNEVGWRVASLTAGGLLVSNAFDAVGRVLKSYMPDGTFTESIYSNTYLQVAKDRAGRTTTFYRDLLGQVTNQLDNAGHAILYNYDAAGNLTNLIDEAGNVTGFDYDEESRLKTKTYDDSSSYVYVYDAEGRLTSKTDAKSITTTYGYDDVGNLTTINYATDTDVAMAYDALNRMTNMVDAVGTTAFTYEESCSALSEVDGPFGNDVVSYAYDEGKRLTNIVVGSHNVRYTLDPLDRITAVTESGGGYFYMYLSNGRLVTELERPNGTVSHYKYDSLRRLTNLIHETASGEPFASFTYAYDNADQRTQLTTEDDKWPRQIDYTYDNIGQLTRALGIEPGYDFSYGYDLTGNPTNQNRNGFVMANEFNALNQNTTSRWSGTAAVFGQSNLGTNGTVSVNAVAAALQTDDGTYVVTNLGVASGQNVYTARLVDAFGRVNTDTVTVSAKDRGYEHDANGNLTNDSIYAYTYNDADRLVNVREADTGDLLMSCEYDGLGRRRERVLYSGGVGTTNRYVYHDWLVVAVLDASDNLLETYTHGPDLSGRLGGAGGIGGILSAWEHGAQTNRYAYHTDVMGNVVRVTDNEETVVSELRYSPFGMVLFQTGTFTPRYQFSSKEYDAPVGLNYYGYRFYSPQLGRWLNRDPIGELGGFNLYAFVQNSPANAIDPLGELTLGDIWKCLFNVPAIVARIIALFPNSTVNWVTSGQCTPAGSDDTDCDDDCLEGPKAKICMYDCEEYTVGTGSCPAPSTWQDTIAVGCEDRCPPGWDWTLFH